MRTIRNTQRSSPRVVGPAVASDASGVSGVLPNTYWLLSAVLFVSAALVGLWRTQ